MLWENLKCRDLHNYDFMALPQSLAVSSQTGYILEIPLYALSPIKPMLYA